MRFGIVTPVLTVLPRAHAAWEIEGRWQDVVDIAMAADRLGYDHLTCSEHVGVPVDVAAVRGGRYFDPLSTFGYLAAVTERIRLATYVLVLGYHHPLEIAKRYGTLDVVSAGRLVLGVGVGSLREEFELLDRPFADRGDRADDALRALCASLSVERPSYQGQHYDFDSIIVDPHAMQANVPIWVGGRTARSLRRATEHADGWAPFGLTPSEISTLLDRARRTEAWSGRSTALDVVLQPVAPIDPVADPDGARASLHELVEAGATHITLRFVHRSPSHYIEQLDAVAALGVSR